MSDDPAPLPRSEHSPQSSRPDEDGATQLANQATEIASHGPTPEVTVLMGGDAVLGPATDSTPRIIGRYRLVEELGKGGFGMVWLAEQTEPIRREVALKIIKPGMDSVEIIARFAAERQALAMMDHPNIAAVLDAGTTESGRPYFVMELVKGVPITEYCDTHRLTIRQRLALFIPVCQAVQHAHQKAILHRDLKPSNILIAEVDGRPVPKVIDFGIAKALGGAPEEALLASLARTMEGMVVGTPQYMSPEQAGSVPDVDTRSDVYTLGVILHELLTGQTPLSREQLRVTAFDDVLRLIREGAVKRPSSRLLPATAAIRQHATERGSDPGKLTATLRGDLDWIVLKALEKERERRYDTANALAQDLRRCLDDEPVSAGPPSAGYRLKKLVQRNRAAFLTAAAILLCLLLGLGASTYAFLRERRALAREAEQTITARYNEGLGWMLRAEVAEERGRQYPGTLLYAAHALGFDGVGAPAGQSAAIRLIRQDRNPTVYQATRDWIRQRPAYLPVWCSAPRGVPITGVSFSAAGRWCAVGAQDGSVQLLDVVSGEESSVSPAGAPPVTAVAFHPAGQLLAVAQGGAVRLWEVPAKAFTTEHPGSAIHLAYSPDGQTLAVAGADGSLRLWAGGKAQVIATGQTTPATNLAFTADHSIVALAFPGVGVRLFFSAVGEAHSAWEKHAGDSTAVAISADGTRLAIGGRDGAIRLWEVASARLLGEVAPEQQHAGAVRALSFRHDGRQLASGAEDATIKLWNIEGQVPTITATLTGPAGAVTELQYAPGGDLLASGGTEGRARLWNVSGQIGTQPDLYHYLADHWLRFEPDTQRLVWDRGAGWANVPADSIIGLWQSGGGGVFPRLLTVGDWTGAIQALQARPEATRPDARAALASALLADARVAAQSGQWNRLDLRLGQLRQIGAPDAPDLAQRRAAQAAEGGDFTNGDGLEMVWCPPTGPEGFLMGSPETEPGRQECENQHRVRLTSGFWIGRSEVTQGQWVAVMGNNPSVKRADEKGLPRLKAPVENVDWIEAMEYCRRLTDRERTRGAIPPGWEYALPTEAQWEYACRAGTTTAYYFGDDPAEFPKHGNYKDIEIGARVKPVDGFTHTAPIRSYLPNPWKLYDMHGNVSEWSRDTMIMGKDRKKTKYPEGDAVDPLETRGTYRVNRGGGARDTVNNCRAAGRYHNEPTFRIDDLGLRAVLTRIRPASTPGP